jgi:cyclophilin family peptidyl-prolyl cis-trans isomerase
VALASAVVVSVAVVSLVWWSGARHGGADVSVASQGQLPQAGGDRVACNGIRPETDEPVVRPGKPPKLALEKDIDYLAVIRTSCGDLKLDLLESSAPVAVNNFIHLARQGFYDGLLWHHVQSGAVIQTGDPNGWNGTSPDGPGYTIEDELPSDGASYTYGTVGMANTGQPNSAGSQFFVVAHDLESALKGRARPLPIEPRYTIFGRVQPKFFGSVENIARQPVIGSKDPVRRWLPQSPIYIESVQILERVRPDRA